ncbi:hypothetical protein M2139_001577 [Enterococcus sp. PF1-24]|uniref:HIRAN domain-containing protein n=1 Tax=unclassified Enterococcus TaxID=2608891 RepID=UPI002476AF97|nr:MULTISPECIES: HIRAN domain-containing protein [unclassified Enterococcus]MDH6364590.1 hypothetical protein [Enterococcus sp. PFB1-1]MDH6401691.1 hypothetical protein [Enterococcus sp. PF1-24]
MGFEISRIERNELELLQQFNLELPDFSMEPIYLDTYTVAGTSHLQDVVAVAELLYKEMPVRLIREDNRYDDLAILIRTDDEKKIKIGYIPRKQNTILAHLLDGGKKISAKVTEYDIESRDYLKILVAVYLDD